MRPPTRQSPPIAFGSSCRGLYHKIEDAVTGAMEEVTLQSMIDDFHRMVPDPTAAAK